MKIKSIPLLLLLAGCGGDSHQSDTPTPTPVPTTTPTPTPPSRRELGRSMANAYRNAFGPQRYPLAGGPSCTASRHLFHGPCTAFTGTAISKCMHPMVQCSEESHGAEDRKREEGQ